MRILFIDFESTRIRTSKASPDEEMQSIHSRRHLTGHKVRFFNRSTLNALPPEMLLQNLAVIRDFLNQLRRDTLHALYEATYSAVLGGYSIYGHGAHELLDCLNDVSPTTNLSRALDIYADVIKVFKRNSNKASWPGEAEKVHAAAVRQINKIGFISNSINHAESDWLRVQEADTHLLNDYKI